MQPKEEIVFHKLPGKSWSVTGADWFTFDNNSFLFVDDYHSTFSIVKNAVQLSADGLITCCKIIFAEYRLPKKMMSDAGTNFVSYKFSLLEEAEH